jgi:hypothetical protein
MTQICNEKRPKSSLPMDAPQQASALDALDKSRKLKEQAPE